MSIYLGGELTHFLLLINGAIDTGRYSTISIHEVECHITDGDLFTWLRTVLATSDFDDLPEDFKTTLTERMRDILGGYRGSEGRKWYVTRSGLCLLVAWSIELLQRGEYEGVDRPPPSAGNGHRLV